jgi:VWFA-related protein
MNCLFETSRVSGLVRRAVEFFLPVLLLTTGVTLARAQEPEDVIRTDTTLVQLNVGVVDKRGYSITNLTAGDFAVFENGSRRPIVHFEPTDAPFSLVMLLDMSGSTVNFRQQINMAALRFLDALSPEDRVAVVSFNGKGVHSLLGFTTDRNRVAYAIGIASGAGTSPVYEAVKFSLKQLAQEGKRRKAIVMLSDGVDTEIRNADRVLVGKASPSEMSHVIKADTAAPVLSVLSEADRQGVTIFPLALPSGDPRRLPLPDPAITAMYTAARSRMQLLADRTGGRLHDIRRLDDLSRLYAQVAADLRKLYTVVYEPPKDAPRDGKWREIRVEVTRGELVASTKPGYYAK